MEFFYLLFAHTLADFPLQGQWLAENKGKYPLFMLAHVIIWTGCICVMMNIIGIEVVPWKLAFLFIGHYLADHYKCILMQSKYDSQYLQWWAEKGFTFVPNQIDKVLERRKNTLVWVDQIWHIVQLLIVYLF